ncbi:ACP S-malonyltransferase [bacterium]|nr:ACP S-malonyltransferase [bacterium]
MTQLAFVFPGQGSQQVGMLSSIASDFPIVTSTFSEASEVLGYDLWQLAKEGSAELQAMTEKTQPLLLTASIALWRAWQSQGGSDPVVMSGHSLGEWSALVCAEVLSFKDAVALVRLRGQFMQHAVPVGVGGMAAIIGLDDDKINMICRQVSQAGVEVAAVNFNSPGQVVIAGHAPAVERAMSECKAAGAKRALSLPVSAPFHTSLMKPASEEMAKRLESVPFHSPKIPVIHNVTADTCENPDKIKALLIEQIYQPVRWVECVEALGRLGAQSAIECGSGKVLSGLVKRINKALPCVSIEAPDSMVSALSL